MVVLMQATLLFVFKFRGLVRSIPLSFPIKFVMFGLPAEFRGFLICSFLVPVRCEINSNETSVPICMKW
jgi:hypothetical protein